MASTGALAPTKCHCVLRVLALLTTGAQAYAPITWMKFPTRGFVLRLEGSRASNSGVSLPQKLMIGDAMDTSPSMVPHFTAQPDSTITWDDMGWCIEAEGIRSGQSVRLDRCTRGPTQRWNWLSDRHGRNMIQLAETNMCLGGIDGKTGLNGSPLELQECGNDITESWGFEEPFPSQAPLPPNDMRHVVIALIALAGVSVSSFGAWIFLVHSKAYASVTGQRVSTSSTHEDVGGAWLTNSLYISDRLLGAKASEATVQGMVPAMMVISEGDAEAEPASSPPDEFSDRAESIKQIPNSLENVAAVDATNPSKKSSLARAVYKFSRPHTIRGTILASVAAVTRAIATSSGIMVSWALLGRAFLGMTALLLGNVYIVGINQVYDKDIDRINKPFLPVAAGELSLRGAWAFVITSLVGGVGLTWTFFSPLIFRLYALGLTLGTVYSVPPLMLKRFPLAAGSIIAVVRGFLLNFGVYYAVREALFMPFKWDPIVLFVSRFMTVFALMIAVTKDLPDVKGDTKFNISTFASRLGVGKVATAATAVLSFNYVSAIVEGAMRPTLFYLPAMLGGHALALAYAVWNRFQLAPDEDNSIKEFYRRIWNLFYFEYLLYIVL